MRKTGASKHSSSKTRASSLAGRTSPLRGSKAIPRSARLAGLKPLQKPDPEKIPWPTDCIIVVAASPATVEVRQIRGRVVDQRCRQCGARLCVDSVTVEEMQSHPLRQRRPIEFLGLDCCFYRYDTYGVKMSRAARRNQTEDAEQ
jgi:hypothetical protein